MNKWINIPCRTSSWRLETIHNASRIPSLHLQFSCDHVITSTRPLVRLLVGVQSTTDWAQTGTQKWGGCQPQVHRLHRHTIHTAHITHHTPHTLHTTYFIQCTLKAIAGPYGAPYKEYWPLSIQSTWAQISRLHSASRLQLFINTAAEQWPDSDRLQLFLLMITLTVMSCQLRSARP